MILLSPPMIVNHNVFMIMGSNSINFFFCSWFNFPDGFCDHKFLKLGNVHFADRRSLAKEKELPGALLDLNINLHFTVSCSGHLFLHKRKRKLFAKRHRHDCSSGHQHLLFDCRSSTLPAA
jgi:hypothetical protein